MIVQRHNHRNAPAERVQRIAHPLDGVRLRILHMLGHHRAMQREKNCVHGSRRLQRVIEHAGDPLICPLLDMSRRAGRRPEQWHDLMPRLLCRFDEPGERQVIALHGLGDAWPTGQRRPGIALLEIGEAGLGGRKGVGFMPETGDGDTGHGDESSNVTRAS